MTEQKPLEEQLKEIRDKYDNDMNSTTPYNVELPYSILMQIQSETYTLGKQAGRDEVQTEYKIEVAEELLGIIKGDRRMWTDKYTLDYLEEFFTAKLTELKEQKK